jgi:HK97 family phage portal protein
MMPLLPYTLKNGVRTPIDPPQLVTSPAAGTSMADWVYMVMTSLLLRGNAYGQIVRRDAMKYPTQIELFNPDDVTPMRDKETGVVTYRVNRKVFAQSDIFHVRAFRMPGIDFGLSPIQQAALTINRDYAIQQFSLGYFQDAPHPSSVLTSDQAINAEAARTIKERLIAAVTGREPLVLGAGLKFTPLSVSPEESQFLATQKYGAAEICRFFGVPPQKVAAADVGSSMTYTTVESSSLDLLVWPIQWWLTNLESAVAALLPGQKHVRFDTSVLLRTDLETRMRATAIGIASHQLTPDEARAIGDMPPLTADQKTELDLVKMTVSPSGMPKALPGTPPTGDPSVVADQEGQPA